VNAGAADGRDELERLLEETRRKLEGKAVELEAHEGLLRLAMEDMRRIYDDLLRSQAQLLQSEKLATIGLLAAGIAHEIKNPLMSAHGLLLILQQHLDTLRHGRAAYQDLLDAAAAGDAARSRKIAALILDGGGSGRYATGIEEIGELVRQSLASLDRIKGIVNDIRMFSRSDKGVTAPEDLNRIMDGVIGLVWNEIKYKIELQRDYAQLPPVRCNAQQVSQVFLNLLVNASQAIEERGRIRVRSGVAEGAAEMAVSDTGSGMTPEVQARVFEPFFTTKDADSGTGLGLSICRDLVAKHGGEIRVESEPGKGTTFTVRLPLGEAG
jgi:two-component system NtrC family sensor kinase